MLFSYSLVKRLFYFLSGKKGAVSAGVIQKTTPGKSEPKATEIPPEFLATFEKYYADEPKNKGLVIGISDLSAKLSVMFYPHDPYRKMLVERDGLPARWVRSLSEYDSVLNHHRAKVE
ncbi:MAG TPA: hypothetical protein VMH27_09140 [Puia sp.]|nr:hypothetical protein [Puia sp.]